MKRLKLLALILGLILLLELGYCLVVFTDWIPPLSRLRTVYIETALGTMNHKWLATAFLPGDVVLEVQRGLEDGRNAQAGLVSGGWTIGTAPDLPEDPEAAFFARFPELEEQQVRSWAAEHPEALSNGWDNFYVNQSALNDPETGLFTRQGDEVLAIDAANGLLVVRIREELFRGVLVLGKDPGRLHCAPSDSWGSMGQRIGDIAADRNALVALTGSGYTDAEGVPQGARQTGAAMCQGLPLGEHLKPGYKRIELRTDDRIYIVDAPSEFHPDCTDATEWTPALIVDGEIVVSEEDHYNARNPRCCLGQTRDGTVLMLCIEGRFLDSLGATAPECAQVLEQYGAYQAMNLDGGNSAICWYQGRCITRCADPDAPEGRLLPNAWLYGP